MKLSKLVDKVKKYLSKEEEKKGKVKEILEKLEEKREKIKKELKTAEKEKEREKLQKDLDAIIELIEKSKILI